MPKCKYSYEFLREVYLRGLSVENIGTQYHVSAMLLAKKFKAEGILRPQGNYKYTHNDKVFDDIDTEEKAYWLGFLYADGAVNGKRPCVALGLAVRDLEHLKKFRDLISPDQANIPRDKVDQVKLTIYNKHFYEKLIMHGCIPQKTFKLRFPTTVPDTLISHFIRGYFDGDGHVGISKNGQPTFSILGNFEFIQTLHEHFLTHIPIYKPGGFLKKGNVYMIQKGGCGLQVEAILKYLYKDATVFLERKKEIADRFAALRSNS